MVMPSNGEHHLAGKNGTAKHHDIEREIRVALGVIARRHLIVHREDILDDYAVYLEAEALTNKTSSGSSDANGDALRGTKASTALATMIDLPAYLNSKKGKPEPAKHLHDFMQSAGPAHYDKVFAYFRDHVITPDYRAAAPAYIQMAIHQVFDMPGPTAGTSHGLTLKEVEPTLDEEVSAEHEQALSSPHAVIAAIEETLRHFIERAISFVGVWNVLRYAHHGRRVVRLAMEVTRHSSGRLTFRLYFRTHGMTVSKSREVYVTRGSLIVLKGGQHVKFLGYEEPLHAGGDVDSYPVSITCPTRITRDGPFTGLVERRHDDGKIFAIKAQFIREKTRTIEELLADKVGSYEGPDDIARMADDITGFEALMADLRRSANDDRGGLVL